MISSGEKDDPQSISEQADTAPAVFFLWSWSRADGGEQERPRHQDSLNTGEKSPQKRGRQVEMFWNSQSCTLQGMKTGLEGPGWGMSTSNLCGTEIHGILAHPNV